jgi:hypothetical protein
MCVFINFPCTPPPPQSNLALENPKHGPMAWCKETQYRTPTLYLLLGYMETSRLEKTKTKVIAYV